MADKTAAWYAVRVLYRAKISSRLRASGKEPLEERIFLVRTAPASAAVVAKKEAARHQHSYRNPHGQKVRWELVQILDIVRLTSSQIHAGTEVYSRFHPNALARATVKRLGFRLGETDLRQ